MERLDQAIRRLESAAAAKVARLAEGDRVMEELRLARQDYARLDGASQLVEDRLDGVIGRLKMILEG
jgi:hypothetical protein